MSNSTAQVLMKKGKRGAAAYILADCASGNPQHLGPLLDVLLNPSKTIDEWEIVDWCRWLMAGGHTPDEFAAVVRSYDQHDKCGLVWIPRVVAYRCRTCGISPCMSICRDCFHRGDHSTHDFNMFLSQAGGACDCGDNSVMKEDGFCSNHGNKCPRPGAAPAELMCVAEAMMPRLMLRLLQHFRENSWGSQTNSDSYRIAVQECEGYVQMLMEFNNMGDLMRSAMTKALINPQMYRDLVQPPFPATEFGGYMRESHNMYTSAVDAFPAPEPPPQYRHLPALAPRLQHHTLLDELIFWTFKYEFPQNVVCFLLNMLPDQDYKEHLTRTFVLHYARIPLVLEAAADPDTLSNRVVHMSVQLFSNEALALRCVQQLHLLHVMVLSLRLMMGKILIRSTLHDEAAGGAAGGGGGGHMVIDCTRRVMKEHCYWPLVSDFNNVLSHRSVALLFLQDDALLDMWFSFLSMLQGMNVNVRETGSHIEFEPSSYYAAFSCELEAAAYPMWSVLAHLTEPAHAPLCARIVAAALGALQAWLRRLDLAPALEARRASFHFPLHRYLAAFLCAGARCMGLRAGSLLPPPRALLLLARHPLRVQSLFYEILAGIWVRNGLQIKGQAMTYIQANFCNSMVDMDIYWLQVCAGHLPADQFLDMCIDTFGVREWLSMAPMSPVQAAEQDSMVEGLLTFLAIIVSSRSNLGNDELTQSRLEVSTLLAAGDKTHSQLLELMPERSGNAVTRNFELVLVELSTYRPPPKGSESLEQGLFVPRPIVWEQYYDPLHVLRRAVHRRDFHASMDRFTAYVRSQQKASGAAGAGVGAGALWPPLRAATAPPPAMPDPRQLCNSGVLHGIILAVLHRAVHCRGEAAGGGGAAHAPADHVVALAVHLLGTGAAAAGALALAVPCAEPAARPPLLAALRGDVCSNARTHVTRVLVPRPVPRPEPAPAMYHSDSDTEWEPAEGERGAGAGSLLPAGSLSPAGSLPPVASTALVVPPPLQMALASGADRERSEGVGGAGGAARRALEDAAPSRALALPAPPPPAPHHLLSILQDMEESEWDVSEAERPALPAPPLPPALLAADAPALPTPCAADQQLCVDNDQAMQLQQECEDSVPVNESIISLLLKLHSQLSGRLDSFSLEEPAPPDSCIGDGPHFIGQVLRRLAAADARCAAHVGRVRRALWPLQRERQAEQRARERREKEERSRRARERQAAVMRDFQRRQQQFMETCGCDAAGDEPAAPTYTCVICSGAAPADTSEPLGGSPQQLVETCGCDAADVDHAAPADTCEPLGLVTLLQSTSVLGHARRRDAPSRLPLADEERARLLADCAMQHHYRRHDDLQQHFHESWVLSVSVGWEGGVAAATCGHRLHLRCLAAYLRSLGAGQRPHNLHVERGEFLCPLCRQLANAALPLAPPPPRAAPPPAEADHAALAADVLAMLQQELPPPPLTRLSEAMGKAMEDITATAGNKLRVRYGSSHAAVLTFVTSLLRGNLELALVARGGTLLQQPPPRYRPKDDCLLPLLVLCSTHARVLRGASDAAAAWALLTGAGGSGAVAGTGASSALSLPARPDPPPVPLLLRDPLHLFTMLLIDQPVYHIRYFTCIVRAVYTLTYYQVVLQLVAGATADARAALAAGGATDGAAAAAAALLAALAGSELFTEDGPPAAAAPAPLPHDANHQLERLLLPLVRCAALVKQHVYGAELPAISAAAAELPALAAYLDLLPREQEWELSAPLPEEHARLAGAWAAQLAAAARCAQLAIRRLALTMHVEWLCPRLLRLPREYERVFSHYHERVCAQCGAVPKECGVCLLCGALVCLKQACCRRAHRHEATQHALECGGGTGIFLVVTSTYIVVIRGGRACLWGSLYLDDYDEEDRDLKRGKPLYLSQDRFELLEAQWLAHRFDHTKRTWVWHRDSL